MVSKTVVGFWPWSRAVDAIEVRVIRVVLPVSDRVPPLTFRATTGPRRLRSAGCWCEDGRIGHGHQEVARWRQGRHLLAQQRVLLPQCSHQQPGLLELLTEHRVLPFEVDDALVLPLQPSPKSRHHLLTTSRAGGAIAAGRLN